MNRFLTYISPPPRNICILLRFATKLRHAIVADIQMGDLFFRIICVAFFSWFEQASSAESLHVSSGFGPRDFDR